MTRRDKWLSAVGLMLLIALVAIAFQGYFTPAMLVDFVIQLCS